MSAAWKGKKMKKKILCVLFISSAVFAVGRPPQPKVEFEYDPDQVDCEILKVFEVQPDNRIIYMPIKAYEEDGEEIKLVCNNPNVWVPPVDNPGYKKETDPNGLVIHKWLCDIRVGYEEKIIYLKFTATDIPSRPEWKPASDCRMILINVKRKNRPPILDWGD
jgi:hypothetical protein